MTPRQLETMLATFDWRCLQRPEAQILGIPAHFRQDWQIAKEMLRRENTDDESDEDSSGDSNQAYEQAFANARAKLEDIEKLSANVIMTPAAQQACERHHDRLAATDATVIEGLVCALDESVWCHQYNGI